MEVFFSVIICTYNPNNFIFERLLNALSLFEDNESFSFEVIIVDNNSRPSVINHPTIIKLSEKINIKTIFEHKSGLTYARVAGANLARGKWVIWFDDDNEPNPDYLIVLYKLILQFPHVGCWGPGNISVEFLGIYERWLLNNKSFFQERHDTGITIDNNREWQYCYPYGTGLAVTKEIMEEYNNRIKSKLYSLADRTGTSLSSGGDVQIVLTGIYMGYSAGISESLKMNHLIQSNKTNLRYVSKMIYGTASSYLPALKQVFDFDLKNIFLPNNMKIIKNVYGRIKKFIKAMTFEELFINITQMLGEIKGAYNVCNKKVPFSIVVFEKIINYK